MKNNSAAAWLIFHLKCLKKHMWTIVIILVNFGADNPQVASVQSGAALPGYSLGWSSINAENAPVDTYQ